MKPPARRKRRPLPSPGRLLAALAFLTIAALRAQDSDSLPEWLGEPNSPEELLPATVTPGLRDRAIPVLEATPEPETQYRQLYRITRPYYDTLFATPPPEFLPPPDPSTFRPVTMFEPPRGLRPRVYRKGLLELYPYFGISQSYDSNVNLTPTDQIQDFFFTPRAGLEFQLGSPDTIWEQGYDTILAAHGSYEGYGDIFYGHPELSAYNQKFELTGRIGRSAAVWRPYLFASDITGSNLLFAELVNRTRRIRVMPGFFSEYKFTEPTSYRQSFNYYLFQHPDPAYINLQAYTTKHELTWLGLHAMRAIVWGQYRYSDPDRGFSGNEATFGLGWQGQPDPRIYSELYLGWGALDMDGDVPGRKNLSGVRFNGYTTFDWGPRYRFTFRYDRDYVYNEVTANDNYVSTLIQFRNEFFLGGNYYLTPYLGIALDEFETSRQVTLQWRPEVELAYALPDESRPGQSRVYLKAGYIYSSYIKGDGLPITQLRLSVGWSWLF